MKKMRILRWLVWPVFLLVLILSSGLVAAQVTPPGPKVDLSITLTPFNYSNALIAGADNQLFLEVRNNGTNDITNIRFGSSAPKDWTVTYSPASLDKLTPGSSTTVDVNIIPAKNTGSGDYNFALTATANEANAVTDVYLKVSGTSYWLWIGFGLGAVVLIGFIIIFVRMNKK